MITCFELLEYIQKDQNLCKILHCIKNSKTPEDVVSVIKSLINFTPYELTFGDRYISKRIKTKISTHNELICMYEYVLDSAQKTARRYEINFFINVLNQHIDFSIMYLNGTLHLKISFIDYNKTEPKSYVIECTNRDNFYRHIPLNIYKINQCFKINDVLNIDSEEDIKELFFLCSMDTSNNLIQNIYQEIKENPNIYMYMMYISTVLKKIYL